MRIETELQKKCPYAMAVLEHNNNFIFNLLGK